MNAAPRIRFMTFDDLDNVLQIEKEVFPDPWSRNSYEFEISNNDYSIAVVMEYRDALVGHAVVWQIYEEFHIATIAIAREYQGRGWGSHFLKSLLGMAGEADYALLEVRRSNTPALRLYEKFGFREFGVRRRYYRNGEDAVVMRKELKCK